MRKTLLYALPAALTAGTLTLGTVVAGAQASTLFPLFPNVEKVRTTAPAGDGFNERLAKEYKALALFEADEMGDWQDADFFAAKSLKAGHGDSPMPSDPAKWDISSAAARSDLAAAHADLTAVLPDGRTKAPVEAAVAQAKYDCWVEQEEEGFQQDHIAACRTAYVTAMDALKKAMQPTKVTYETVQSEVARQTVYFDWDKAGIRTDQLTNLDAFLAKMRKIEPVTLYIEGHADTSGPADYNAKLSERRAENVRAELVKQGMTVGEIRDLKLEAKGEADPAVPTGDGVKEQRNRRVVVIATGQTKREVTTTSMNAAPAKN